MQRLTEDIIGICRFFAAFERESICCGSVTVSQCVALQALLEGGLDLSGLAAFSGSSASAMTRLVDGLEGRGWVQRRRDEQDRRRVLIHLTEAGRSEASRLRGLTDLAVEQVLSHVPDDRRDDVAGAVSLLRRAIEAASAEGLPCC